MAFEVGKSPGDTVVETMVPGAIPIAFETIQVVPGMEVVNPVVLGGFTVVPGPVGILARTAIEHGPPGHIYGLGILRRTAHFSQQRRSEHIGVVDGTLLECHVAQTSAGVGVLAGQLQNPPAGAASHVEILRVFEGFISCKKGLANKTAPDNCGL